MFQYKPDFNDARKRMNAWWEGKIIDRPPAFMTIPRPEEQRLPVPQKEYSDIREQWLDTEFKVAQVSAQLANLEFLAEAIPVAFPNLGPEIFSAFYGCPLEFGERTSWSEPILASLTPDTVAELRLDKDNFYYRKMLEMTAAYIQAGRDKFIIGYTDLHGGADAVAAFRDPQQFCFDLLEDPDTVKQLCDRITDDFLEVYDVYDGMIKAAGMPSTSWLPMYSDGKYHIPSNDFSCMISEEMFAEFFIPGLERECSYMTHNIYHLDGPGALRHLDRIMDIPNLQAIQWVPGAGHEGWRNWIDVYRRIQERGKGFIVYLAAEDLDDFIKTFSAKGAFLQFQGVKTRQQADGIIRKLENWK